MTILFHNGKINVSGPIKHNKKVWPKECIFHFSVAEVCGGVGLMGYFFKLSHKIEFLC